MQLPHFLPDTLKVLRLSKDEEELLALLRTRSLAKLLLFFTTMAQDEGWCESHTESVKYVVTRLTDAFLARELTVEQALEMATHLRAHYEVLSNFLAKDLLCLVQGKAHPISSVLLGVESSIIRSWLYDQQGNSSALEKRFALGAMSLETYRCLEEWLTKGTQSLVLLSTLEGLKSHLVDAVTWDLSTFRKLCIEAISIKLSVQDLPLFMPLAIQRRLPDLKKLCADVWSHFDSGIELEIEGKEGLGFIIHAFHLSKWPVVKYLTEYVTRLTFCNNTASHALTKDLVQLCPKATYFDLSLAQSCDETLIERLHTAEELRLASCPWLDNAHIEQLFSYTPKLKRLDLSNNPQITKPAWNHLKYYGGLQSLKLTYYHIAQQKELLLILLLLASKATEVDLSWSSGVQDESVEVLTKHNQDIQILRLSHCENLTEAMLRYLQERLSKLHTLDVSGDAQLSEQALEHFALNHPALHTLDVRYCRVSALTLAHIRDKRPDLVVITS